MLYDEDGNLLGYGFGDLDADNDVDVQDYNLARGSYTGRTFGWTAENRLQTVRYREGPDVSILVVLRYDAFGQRIEKTVLAVDNQGQPTVRENTRFVYDGWRVIMELDGLSSNAVKRKYTWGLDLAGQSGQGNSLEGAGGIGGLLALEDVGDTGVSGDERTFIYTYDANGNVGQLIETTAGANYGDIAAHYEYSAFGQRINPPAAGEYDQPYRFSTKPFDAETGLGYWGYRHYSPVLGRWMSRDPIGERGGLNLYAYVNNAPSRRVDPFGLTADEPIDVTPDGFPEEVPAGPVPPPAPAPTGNVWRDSGFWSYRLLQYNPKTARPGVTHRMEYELSFTWGCDEAREAYAENLHVDYNLVGELDSAGFSVLVVGVTGSDRVDNKWNPRSKHCDSGDPGTKLQVDIYLEWIQRVSVGLNPGVGPFSWDFGLSIAREKKIGTKHYKCVIDCCCKGPATGTIKCTSIRSTMNARHPMYGADNVEHGGDWPH